MKESTERYGISRYAASLRLAVAPMLDWTDTHCRVFHRVLAPHARLFTEMVHANAVVKGDRKRLLAFDPGEHPVVLQLGGSDPAVLTQAAAIGEEWGYDEINLNVGCPSDRVQAGRFGACLMKDPGLVADCVAAMAAAVAVPVTVKCRLGVDNDDEYEKFQRFIDTVSAAGCTNFIVHARNAWLSGLSPKENREIPPLRPDWGYRLKRDRPHLNIVINGGIAAIATAKAHLRHCDGIMLGRAAYHDPYLLHRLDADLYRDKIKSRVALLRAFRPYVETKMKEGVALKHMARHMLGLYHEQPGGRSFRRTLSEGMQRPTADWSLVEEAIRAARTVDKSRTIP
ncbi:MAG: tRNA dihydrouridine(20/20a) synthase DusA [Xanthomonadaceae bacterium]|nr:tRNA dihydrouridine(20/20a) synthase DusA [Xanthomonadaceae bacterium]